MNKGTREAEQDFGYQSLASKPVKPLTGPLRLVIRFYRAKGIPSTKKGREAALAGQIRPIKKPDNSNLLKMAEDALNGIYFIDDAQIVSHSIEKFFSDTPRTEVEISEVNL
jgi:Holliday junction resolvase RusA-like endonuclease